MTGLDLCVEIEALGCLPHPQDFHSHKGFHLTKATVPIATVVTANYGSYPLAIKPVNGNFLFFWTIHLLNFDTLRMVAKSFTSW